MPSPRVPQRLSPLPNLVCPPLLPQASVDPPPPPVPTKGLTKLVCRGEGGRTQLGRLEKAWHSVYSVVPVKDTQQSVKIKEDLIKNYPSIVPSENKYIFPRLHVVQDVC